MEVPRAVSTTTSGNLPGKGDQMRRRYPRGYGRLMEEQELVSVQVVDPWLIE